MNPGLYGGLRHYPKNAEASAKAGGNAIEIWGLSGCF